MQLTTDALVLKERIVADKDKLITILTPSMGKMSVMIKGGHTLNNKNISLGQPYTYLNIELYERNGYYWLRGGSVIEPFFAIRNDLDKLSLAAYLSDIADELTGEDVPSVDILRMTLNTFYALCYTDKPHQIIKGTYELRAAGFSGFMPCVDGCCYCKTTSCDFYYLDVMNGRIICDSCMKSRTKNVKIKYDPDIDYNEERSVLCPISASVAAAVSYVLHALPERMFSFSLYDNEELLCFERTAEIYLLSHIEHSFASLDFYKSLK